MRPFFFLRSCGQLRFSLQCQVKVCLRRSGVFLMNPCKNHLLLGDTEEYAWCDGG
jgi:hypothetical protein